MGRARYTLGMVAILLLCLLVALLALVWMAAGIVTRSPRAWRLAVSSDQLGNVVAGGDEDETISARCWRYRTEQPYKALRSAKAPPPCTRRAEATTQKAPSWK